MLPITTLFAGFLTLYYVRLALAVIRLRKSQQVSLGAGGNSDLEVAIRVHGTFAEYVPLGLILLGLLEFHSAQPVVVAVLGCTLVLGRFYHAQGLRLSNIKNRVRGMGFTFGTLATLAVLNIVFAIKNLSGFN